MADVVAIEPHNASQTTLNAAIAAFLASVDLAASTRTVYGVAVVMEQKRR